MEETQEYHRLRDEKIVKEKHGWCDFLFDKNERKDDEDEEDEEAIKIHATISSIRAILRKLQPKINEMNRRRGTTKLAMRQFIRVKDKDSAKRKLHLFKRLGRITTRWVEFENVLQNAILTLEEALMANTIYMALGTTNKALDKIVDTISEEKVVGLMNSLSEKSDDVVAMSDALAQPIDCLGYMDEELDDELDKIEASMLEDDILKGKTKGKEEIDDRNNNNIPQKAKSQNKKKLIRQLA